MPETIPMDVKKLKLDLTNFRTMPQENEAEAVQAMISMSPDTFWALFESLVDDGYLLTENIIVLEGKHKTDMVVKEGNRRIAALKLIHGDLKSHDITIPEHLSTKIEKLPTTWRKENRTVPCTIFKSADTATADRIVALAHGKGEKAGRDQWNAVARARHNRNVNKANEPALDLLEKYLEHGKNLTPQQATRWAGDFPLSVLAETIQKIAPRFGLKSSAEFAEKYPSLPHRDTIDNIMRDVGHGVVRFETIRKKEAEFVVKYALPDLSASVADTKPKKAEGEGQPRSSGGGGDGVQDQKASGTVKKKMVAVSIRDPKAVARTLRNFKPVGDRREKVVTLRDEALNLRLNKNPLAFCFVLRSMFEISAKAYCEEHKGEGGPSATKSDGTDRILVEVMRDITAYMTKGNKNAAVKKTLHGAMAELATPEGLLSVTSMNQLSTTLRFLSRKPIFANCSETSFLYWKR